MALAAATAAPRCATSSKSIRVSSHWIRYTNCSWTGRSSGQSLTKRSRISASTPTNPTPSLRKRYVMNDLDLTSAHSDSATGRQRAREFLLRLEKHLERGLPEASNVVEGILKTQREARQRGKTGSEAYEGPFFKSHVIPAVHSFLIAEGLTRDEAIKSLLAEGYLDLLGYASGTPASKRLYPFKKSIAATLKDARKACWEDGKVLFNSCPDLALRSPCEHSVVFEGMLFRSDSLEVAKSAIVTAIFD